PGQHPARGRLPPGPEPAGRPADGRRGIFHQMRWLLGLLECGESSPHSKGRLALQLHGLPSNVPGFPVARRDAMAKTKPAAAEVAEGKQPFDFTRAFRLLREAVRPYPKAALF